MEPQETKKTADVKGILESLQPGEAVDLRDRWTNILTRIKRLADGDYIIASGSLYTVFNGWHGEAFPHPYLIVEFNKIPVSRFEYEDLEIDGPEAKA